MGRTVIIEGQGILSVEEIKLALSAKDADVVVVDSMTALTYKMLDEIAMETPIFPVERKRKAQWKSEINNRRFRK